MAAKQETEADKVALVHLIRPHSTAIEIISKPVVVKVGAPPKTFFVNEALLSDNSPFFQAALKQEWTKGRSRVVRLPEQTAEAFTICVNWLYQRKLCIDLDAGASRNENTVVSRCIDAYVLGDMFLDSDFKDAVLDAFVLVFPIRNTFTGRRYLPHSNCRAWLYANTMPDSMPRKLIVHCMARVTSEVLINEEDDHIFLIDLAREQMRKDSEDTLAAAARCEFHEHAKGVEHCYRQKYGGVTSLSASGGAGRSIMTVSK